MNSSIKKFGLAATLSLAAIVAHAANQAEPSPAPASPAPVTASAAQGGLTRAQVLEDLKRYQREHANPSYAELVFLR
ncbi:hypothetical protein [Herbaspirillum camelliae]|uniref:hypothetical protein n=1 Tax=Herbaspirillum camelliae TaxID=1892903 RepID=UPI000949EC34|nr:hypothetical protein [Herbaspirillum camelliae]